jgi:hypothetical protein
MDHLATTLSKMTFCITTLSKTLLKLLLYGIIAQYKDNYLGVVLLCAVILNVMAPVSTLDLSVIARNV